MGYILGFLTAAALGTALRGLYSAWPLPLLGVIAPISGSLWEELKLLLWPYLGGAALTARRSLSQWGSVCLGLLLMPPVYLAGLGLVPHRILWTRGLYYVTLALGFGVLHWEKKWTDRTASVFIMLAGIWTCCTFILSMYPPDLPFFRS